VAANRVGTEAGVGALRQEPRDFCGEPDTFFRVKPVKYLAVRDDDLCFFTQPRMVAALYETVLPRVPVSFAAVSHTVPKHGACFSNAAAPGYYALGENRALVDYVRGLLNKRQCEVMVHGYTHEERVAHGTWQAECIWKPQAQLTEEIAQGCNYLTELFGVRPRVFVPPNNAIGRAGVEAAVAAGLDLSALLSLRPDRPWSRNYAACYQQRWAYSLAHRRPYPFTLDFDTHRELVAYRLHTTAAFENVMSCLRACAEVDAPFVVATRYWQLAADEGLHSALLRVIDAALDLGYLPATVSDAISGRRQAPNLAKAANRASVSGSR